MQLLKSKVITIATFWVLTGLMVLSLPIKGTISQEQPVSSNELPEQKVSLLHVTNHQSL